jgi:hypothetical protein
MAWPLFDQCSQVHSAAREELDPLPVPPEDQRRAGETCAPLIRQIGTLFGIHVRDRKMLQSRKIMDNLPMELRQTFAVTMNRGIFSRV